MDRAYFDKVHKWNAELAKQVADGNYEKAKEAMREVIHLANVNHYHTDEDFDAIEMHAQFRLGTARRRSCARQLRPYFNYVKSERRDGREIGVKEDYALTIEQILDHHEMPKQYVSAVMGYTHNLLYCNSK